MDKDRHQINAPSAKVRLDKWLWAARFFKTRAKAKQAIEGGKVHLDNQKAKASKELVGGEMLKIRQGFDQKTVKVIALSEQRRGAPEAALLYEEMQISIETRALAAEQRRAANSLVYRDSRPTKKDRRVIHKFNEKFLSDDK